MHIQWVRNLVILLLLISPVALAFGNPYDEYKPVTLRELADNPKLHDGEEVTITGVVHGVSTYTGAFGSEFYEFNMDDLINVYAFTTESGANRVQLGSVIEVDGVFHADGLFAGIRQLTFISTRHLRIKHEDTENKLAH